MTQNKDIDLEEDDHEFAEDHCGCSCSCTICDTEGSMDERIAKYWESTSEKIREFGHVVVAVFPEGDDPGFAYTVGAQTELIVFGLSPDFATQTLNDLVEKMKKFEPGERFGEGQVVKLGDGSAAFGVKIVTATEKAKKEYTFQATKWRKDNGGGDYEVLQVLVPDPEGIYPDDPLCRPPYSEQPVLT